MLSTTTTVTVRSPHILKKNDLGFETGKITDIASANAVAFKEITGGKGIEFVITVPFGETRLLRVSPAEPKSVDKKSR